MELLSSDFTLLDAAVNLEVVAADAAVDDLEVALSNEEILRLSSEAVDLAIFRLPAFGTLFVFLFSMSVLLLTDKVLVEDKVRDGIPER